MKRKSDRAGFGWFTIISMIVALLVLSIATFAWFQQNRLAETSTATARSGDENVELELSSSGGAGFTPEETVSIQQVNSADVKELMPVSTADLGTFVTNRVTKEEVAEVFEVVKDENYYYHGRIYMRAKAGKDFDGSKMTIYLTQSDETGGAIVKSDSAELMNASRLGLKISGGEGGGNAILSLSSAGNASDDRALNTKLNGVLLSANQVLDASSGSIRAVSDPSKLIDSVCVARDAGGYSLPDESVAEIEMNTVYQVDVYFYLEGCDPDCTNPISYEASNLHLAFLGILSE